MKNIFFAIACFILAAPSMAFAEGEEGTGAAYENPLKFDKVDDVITSFLEAMQSTIVVLAIVFIVIGGILYIFSAGDESRIGTAKKAFTAAIVGLAIGIAAPTFLREVYKILDATNTPEIVDRAPTIAEILARTLEFLLSIAGVIALIAMVIGGIMYLTAGGDEKNAETGKKMFKAATIGIVIIMAALVVVTQVSKFFI